MIFCITALPSCCQSKCWQILCQRTSSRSAPHILEIYFWRNKMLSSFICLCLVHSISWNPRNLTPLLLPPPFPPPPPYLFHPTVHFLLRRVSVPLSTKFMRSWQNLMCFILQTSIVVHSLTTPITCQKSHNARSYSLLILQSFIQHRLISMFTPTMSFHSFFNPLRVMSCSKHWQENLMKKKLNAC